MEPRMLRHDEQPEQADRQRAEQRGGMSGGSLPLPDTLRLARPS